MRYLHVATFTDNLEDKTANTIIDVSVQWDISSDAVFFRWDEHPEHFLAGTYEEIPISPQLIGRMKMWCSWQESALDMPLPDGDKIAIAAYGHALAVDLAIELGAGYRVFYGDIIISTPIERIRFRSCEMTWYRGWVH